MIAPRVSALPAPGSPRERAALEALAEGFAALDDYRWQDAKEAFSRALSRHESPEAHEGLADALARLGQAASGLLQREAAYRSYRQRGDLQGAARVATRLGAEYADLWGETAVGQGWLRRAERLLEDLEPGPEQAWLTVWKAHLAIVVDGDMTAATRLAHEAEALGRQLGIPAVEMLAQAQQGMVLVQGGRPSEGFALLDEVAAAAVAGEIDNIEAAGATTCYVLHACEHLLDYERSFQWCRRSTALNEGRGLAPVLTFCRGHLSRVHVWEGEWQKAEEDLLRVLEEFVPFAPAYIGVSRIQLAELRRRQGRYDEALALLDESDPYPTSMGIRAGIALDQGEPAKALELVDRYFRRLDPGEILRRTPGLDVLARAHAQLGRLEPAQEALEELRELARAGGTIGMQAVCAAVTGVIAAAAGDACEARRAFEDACDLFRRSGAPFEAACSRAELARCLAAAGRAEEARREAEAARGTFRELGAPSRAAQMESLLDELGGESALPRTPEGALALLSERELQVLAEIAVGRSNQEIARRLYLSVHTVKRHVANVLAKLDLPSRTAAAALAVRHGISSPAA